MSKDADTDLVDAEQFEAVAESIKYIQVYDRLIDRIGMEKVEELIKRESAAGMLCVFREALFS